MHDAHCHLSKEILSYTIPKLYNVANFNEYKIVKEHKLAYSCGVHPWHASVESLQDMLPILKQAPIIGEIGMDSVWCDVDLQLQKVVFEKQVQLAKDLNKPVLLHTKGQEKAILDIIKKYPNTYIVHWYGCTEYIEAYNEVASYFTIGPSIRQEEALRKVVKMVSIDKLLLESDGIDAVKWAVGNVNYLDALKNEIQEISRIKHLECEETERILDENFRRIVF